MSRVEYSRQFAADYARISSSRVEQHVRAGIANLALFPEMGSAYLRDSVREAYGEGVRKVSVNPFDILYTYIPEEDLVRLEALLHQRNVR